MKLRVVWLLPILLDRCRYSHERLQRTATLTPSKQGDKELSRSTVESKAMELSACTERFLGYYKTFQIQSLCNAALDTKVVKDDVAVKLPT
jgi:hypothetical protein